MNVQDFFNQEKVIDLSFLILKTPLLQLIMQMTN